jgi:glycerophosphoryl diester phosphodiesterase
MSRPLVIAHRGASGHALENTLAAFRAAVTHQADGVELDVHGAADGELIVHHDDVLPNGAVIARSTAAQVGAVRLANGEPPPTLAQALDAIGPRLLAFVEVKRLAPALDERLLAVLAAGPHPAGYAVHSFDHRVVRRLVDRQPGLRTGVLGVGYHVRPAGALHDAGARDLWQEQSLIDADLAAAVHRAGGRLIAWTVDAPERIRQLVAAGVDGICTNLPDVGRRAVDSLAA